MTGRRVRIISARDDGRAGRASLRRCGHLARGRRLRRAVRLAAFRARPAADPRQPAPRRRLPRCHERHRREPGGFVRPRRHARGHDLDPRAGDGRSRSSACTASAPPRRRSCRPSRRSPPLPRDRDRPARASASPTSRSAPPTTRRSSPARSSSCSTRWSSSAPPGRQQHGRAGGDRGGPAASPSARARHRPAEPRPGLAARPPLGGAAAALRPELGLLQPAPRRSSRAIVRRLSRGGDDGWAAAGVDEFLRSYLTPRGRAAFYAAARNIYLDEPHGDDGFWTRLPRCSPRPCSSGAARTRWCRSAS